MALLGLPAELAVPVVRRLRGRSGVATGPGLTNLADGVVALGLVHHLRRHPQRWQRWSHRDVPRWGVVAVLAHLVLSPVAAAGWARGVVLPGRSPLWGGLVSPVGLLQVVVGAAALRRVLRDRSADATEGPAGRGAQSS